MPEELTFPTDHVLEHLQRVDLFSGLADSEVEGVAGIVRGMSAEDGELLFEEGESGNLFYIVVDGAVEIVKSATGGVEERLAVRRAGEVFGEMALLNDAPRSATARTKGPVALLTIARDDFTELLGGDGLAIRMMQMLSKALRALGVRFAAAERGMTTTVDDDPVDERVSDVNRALQRALLPQAAPRIEGFDLAAGTMLEDRGTGDTIWDVVDFGGGRHGLLVLRVDGEGLPPAHHLAVARAFLREGSIGLGTAETLLQRVSQALSRNAVSGVEQYVACGLLAPHDGTVTWTSAGSVMGAVLRRGAGVEELEPNGPPLAMTDGARYGTQEIEMGAGDIVVVLSHGSAGLFRGATDLVTSVRDKPAGEIVSTVHTALRRAQGDEVNETTVLFARKH